MGAIEDLYKRKRDRELNDLRIILSTSEGRRVVWRLLEFAGIYKQTFTGELGTSGFNEGKRLSGLHILNEIGEAKAMHTLHQMQREAGSMLEQEMKEVQRIKMEEAEQ